MPRNRTSRTPAQRFLGLLLSSLSVSGTLLLAGCSTPADNCPLSEVEMEIAASGQIYDGGIEYFGGGNNKFCEYDINSTVPYVGGQVIVMWIWDLEVERSGDEEVFDLDGFAVTRTVKVSTGDTTEFLSWSQNGIRWTVSATRVGEDVTMPGLVNVARAVIAEAHDDSWSGFPVQNG